MPPSVSPDPVTAALRAALASLRGRRGESPLLSIAVALSGGRDSMVLLDALARLAPESGVALSAIHVHHGLSPNADAWAAFCAGECERRNVPLADHRVDVERAPGASLEATARRARFAALRRAGADADLIALAHHADDQAETVLLQLLRGAGPLGLAAMPEVRRAGGPALWRPLLALPRAAIDDYVLRHRVGFIDDESNADTGLRRNFLRHEIAPRLAAAFPGYPATLARAAAHSAEAAHLADELARIDAAGAIATGADGTPGLARDALAALAATAPARARNLLRWFIRRNGLPLPSSARLAAMLDQLAHAAPDARVRLVHAGAELGIHRGRIAVHPPPVARYEFTWNGEPALTLPHGTLRFDRVHGDGIAAERIAPATVTVRPRAGGERIRLALRPARTLKRLLQESGVPAWQRDGWPLVWCGDALAAVPGIGVAAEFAAPPGAPGLALRWCPAAAVDTAPDNDDPLAI